MNIWKLDQIKLRENGGFAIPAVLYIDALSVHMSVCATYIKPPAEKGLLAHVQYLREAMERCILHALAWIDTRDMTSDGLTKGATDRAQLHKAMIGEIAFNHTLKYWRPALLKRQTRDQSEIDHVPSPAPKVGDTHRWDEDEINLSWSFS